jgi:hypothetical protein
LKVKKEVLPPSQTTSASNSPNPNALNGDNKRSLSVGDEVEDMSPAPLKKVTLDSPSHKRSLSTTEDQEDASMSPPPLKKTNTGDSDSQGIEVIS